MRKICFRIHHLYDCYFFASQWCLLSEKSIKLQLLVHKEFVVSNAVNIYKPNSIFLVDFDPLFFTLWKIFHIKKMCPKCQIISIYSPKKYDCFFNLCWTLLVEVVLFKCWIYVSSCSNIDLHYLGLIKLVWNGSEIH